MRKREYVLVCWYRAARSSRASLAAPARRIHRYAALINAQFHASVLNALPESLRQENEDSSMPSMGAWVQNPLSARPASSPHIATLQFQNPTRRPPCSYMPSRTVAVFACPSKPQLDTALAFICVPRLDNPLQW